MVDHGIKISLFKTKLLCSFFVVFSHLVNAYLAAYVLNPKYKI